MRGKEAEAPRFPMAPRRALRPQTVQKGFIKLVAFAPAYLDVLLFRRSSSTAVEAGWPGKAEILQRPVRDRYGPGFLPQLGRAGWASRSRERISRSVAEAHSMHQP